MVKTLADYITWRNKAPALPVVDEYRPPVPLINYDKPITQMFSSLDSDPIIKRVLENPKIKPSRAFPIFSHPAYHFFGGAWTGAMFTFIFTTIYLGRKEIEDLVKFDPRYFPEFAKKASA